MLHPANMEAGKTNTKPSASLCTGFEEVSLPTLSKWLLAP